MLTLLSLNIIMGYYIGHEERMICFTGISYAMCTRIVTVYAQSTMSACAVYTSTTLYVSELIVGSQRYPQHLGATTILQTTVAAVSIFANQPLTNRAGRPFFSIVAETLLCDVTLLIQVIPVT